MSTERQSITALIPCFNAAAFLATAIDSIRAQTRTVHEILVVDDGSTDESADLAERLGARVLRLPRNAGNAAARNAGLGEVETELVAFLDADDWWYPDHCATLAGLLDEHPTAIAAFGGLDVINPMSDDALIQTPGVPEGPPQEMFELCAIRWIGQPTGSIVKTDALRGVGGCDVTLRLAVDFDLWLRLSEAGPFVASHRRTAAYVRHPGQISNRRTEQHAMAYVARRRAWERAELAGNIARRDRVADIMRALWLHDMRTAWGDRNADRLRSFLDIAPLVPGIATIIGSWPARARLMGWLDRTLGEISPGMQARFRKQPR